MILLSIRRRRFEVKNKKMYVAVKFCIEGDVFVDILFKIMAMEFSGLQKDSFIVKIGPLF